MDSLDVTSANDISFTSVDTMTKKVARTDEDECMIFDVNADFPQPYSIPESSLGVLGSTDGAICNQCKGFIEFVGSQ